jgi:hypothetical protein
VADPQTPPAAVDTQALAVAVAAAMAPIIQQMQAAQAETIAALIEGQKAGVAESVKAARTKRPESYLGDFPFPGTSHWSPDGSPLETLRCESFLGYWEEDENGGLSIIAGYPYLADEHGGCTNDERRALNVIQPGVFKARRRDGAEGIVRVQLKHDMDGTPTRLVIAVPKPWLTKQMKNMIGGIEFLSQLHPSVARLVERAA